MEGITKQVTNQTALSKYSKLHSGRITFSLDILMLVVNSYGPKFVYNHLNELGSNFESTIRLVSSLGEQVTFYFWLQIV